MKTRKTRFLSALLALVMVVLLLPAAMPVMAEEDAIYVTLVDTEESNTVSYEVAPNSTFTLPLYNGGETLFYGWDADGDGMIDYADGATMAIGEESVTLHMIHGSSKFHEQLPYWDETKDVVVYPGDWMYGLWKKSTNEYLPARYYSTPFVSANYSVWGNGGGLYVNSLLGTIAASGNLDYEGGYTGDVGEGDYIISLQYTATRDGNIALNFEQLTIGRELLLSEELTASAFLVGFAVYVDGVKVWPSEGEKEYYWFDSSKVMADAENGGIYEERSVQCDFHTKMLEDATWPFPLDLGTIADSEVVDIRIVTGDPYSRMLNVRPAVFYADEKAPIVGNFGNDFCWAFYERTGELTISGKGDMPNQTTASRPWDAYKDEIKSVVFSDGITAVGSYAFDGYGAITSVTLPDGLVTVGTAAFRNCSSLTEIDLPDSVTTIKSAAFSNCSLKSVKMPASLQSIYSYAFHANRSLPEIVIPSNVSLMQIGIFESCSNLKTVYVQSPTIVSALTEADACGKLLTYAKNVYIPGTITAVPDFVTAKFHYTDWAYVDDLDYIRYIEDLAGTCGEGLAWELDLATGHMTITGTGKMDNYGWVNADHYEDYMIPQAPWCSYSNLLKSVTIGEGVTGIGSYAFCGSQNLVSVEFPVGLTSIDRYAFYECNSLVSIEFPAGLTSLGMSAFFRCSSLENVEFPASLTSIGQWAFCECSSLTKVYIPATVTDFSVNAFSGCGKLTEIRVDANNPAYCDQDGVLYSKDMKVLCWYPGGKAETSLVIPASVTSIANFALNVSQLATVYIRSSAIATALTDQYACGRLMVNAKMIGIDASIKTVPIYLLVNYPYAGQHTVDGVVYNMYSKTPFTHVCEFGEWANKDETQHVRACACGEKEYAAHEWNEGKVTLMPTVGATGTKTYTCLTCSGTKQETLPKLEIPAGLPAVIVDRVTALVGREFRVSLRLQNNPGLWSVAFELPIDGDVFEFVSADYTGSVFHTAAVCGYDEMTGTYKFNRYHSDNFSNVTEDGLLVTLTLRVKDGVAAGDHLLTVAPQKINCIDVDQKQYDLYGASSLVTVVEGALGDANGDGGITNADALSIFRYIYSAELYPLDVPAAADVNGDGNVSNADVLAIFRYIYNAELYPLG